MAVIVIYGDVCLEMYVLWSERYNIAGTINYIYFGIKLLQTSVVALRKRENMAIKKSITYETYPES